MALRMLVVLAMPIALVTVPGLRVVMALIVLNSKPAMMGTMMLVVPAMLIALVRVRVPRAVMVRFVLN